ncbi:MAG: HAMP domain-containing protein [Gemmatimonadetes bacterium]|nr:HAMP domain-containing protein [Gemmatimonadota bacterium]
MSLRTRALLLFLLFVVVPLGAVGVVSSVAMKRTVEQVVEASLDKRYSAASLENERPTGVAASSGPEDGVPYESTVHLRLREAMQEGSLGSEAVEEILAPLDRIRTAYIAFMLLVAAVATLGFQFVSHRIFSSLEEFRAAVERIAEGDFAPWLPPPGRDELGWLSLALGRMGERIDHMMRHVEQSGRLAVVGEMAAHVAHEVRTPLSSIKMNLQLLEREADAGVVPADSRINIDTSLREIARLEETVARFLDIGASESGLRRRCSLHALIAESAGLVGAAMERNGVELRLDLAAESDDIWADHGRIKGVFLNLLVNALQAMPDGGEIAVETQLFLGDGGRQMIAVAVSDSGPGVPSDLREDIFHPFFTTKAHGSGIGLPGALRAVRDHGGDLYLGQRPHGDPGACFVALFALADPISVGGLQAPSLPPALEPLGRPGVTAEHRLRWARFTEATGDSPNRA